MLKNEQKMTEQQFLRILTSSVCGILMCLVGLVSTTWAWYNMEIECTGNVIEVGQFTSIVSVTKDDIVVDPSEEKAYSLLPGTYTVQIESQPGSTSPGYCVITFNGDDASQTAALYPAEGGAEQTSMMTFELVLNEAGELEFGDVLGMPTGEALADHDTLELPEAAEEPVTDEDEPEESVEEDEPEAPAEGDEPELPTTLPSGEETP